MKKIFLFFIIIPLLAGQVAFAQNYYSFPDSNAVWTIATIDWGNYTENKKYGIIGDTLINSINYKKIGLSPDTSFNPINAEYFCAVRDYNKKWYFIEKDSLNEKLLYDFDVSEGSTLVIDNPWAYGITEVYIDSIDSIEINGTYRKRINTSFPLGGFPEQWIEGIGCNNGLFYSGYYLFDYGHQLLCFHYNDSLYYLNSPNDSCFYITTNINDKNILLDNILIYPNPVKNTLIINNRNLFIQKIEITNILGGIIKYEKYNLQNIISIDFSEYNKGIYFIKIYNNKNLILNKIIKI